MIRKVHEDFQSSLIFTENGISTADDTHRAAFIRRALQGMENCLNDRIPVKGYCCWSLMDSFEWQKGHAMTFGLIPLTAPPRKKTKESLKYLGSFSRARQVRGPVPIA